LLNRQKHLIFAVFLQVICSSTQEEILIVRSWRLFERQDQGPIEAYC
jgi:hypothetical protein